MTDDAGRSGELDELIPTALRSVEPEIAKLGGEVFGAAERTLAVHGTQERPVRVVQLGRVVPASRCAARASLEEPLALYRAIGAGGHARRLATEIAR